MKSWMLFLGVKFVGLLESQRWLDQNVVGFFELLIALEQVDLNIVHVLKEFLHVGN